jgi:hypothetical protein
MTTPFHHHHRHHHHHHHHRHHHHHQVLQVKDCNKFLKRAFVERVEDILRKEDDILRVLLFPTG